MSHTCLVAVIQIFDLDMIPIAMKATLYCHQPLSRSRGLYIHAYNYFSITLFQYHVNKLSIMSSENHLNNSDKEVDEVDAALSDLEITLEGGKTSTILVRTEK